MSEISLIFRHCPSCGRRFHVRLVNKRLISDRVVREKLTPAEEEAASSLVPAAGFTILREGPSLEVDIEDFNYTYECGHCGHQWSEVHEKEATHKD